MAQRAEFPERMQEVRDLAPELIESMELFTDWYASVYVEDTKSQSFRSDSMQERIDNSDNTGARLRIYDGKTFHEEATNDLSRKSLVAAAERLRDRVEREGNFFGPRNYKPESWAERDIDSLDPEIRSQIPDDVNTDSHHILYQNELGYQY